jgi:hypothetical protein
MLKSFDKKTLLLIAALEALFILCLTAFFVLAK